MASISTNDSRCEVCNDCAATHAPAQNGSFQLCAECDRINSAIGALGAAVDAAQASGLDAGTIIDVVRDLVQS